jgi:hypothetical protein
MSRRSSRKVNALDDASVFDQPGSANYEGSLANEIRKKFDSLNKTNNFDAIQALVTATENYKKVIEMRTLFTMLSRGQTSGEATNAQAAINNSAEAAKKKAYRNLQIELELVSDESKTVPSCMDGKEHNCAICNERLINHGESDKVYAVDSRHLNYSGDEIECGHKFHKLCIKEWLKTSNDCPLCRSVVIKLRLAKQEQAGGKKNRPTIKRKMNKKKTMKKRAIRPSRR